MAVRKLPPGSCLLYQQRPRPEAMILHGRFTKIRTFSRSLCLARTAPCRLPGVNLQRGKKDSSVFGDFKQPTRKSVLHGERDLKALADQEAQDRISSLESELDALKRSKAAETDSLNRVKRKLEAKLQEIGQSKETITRTNETLQSDLKGLSLRIQELGSREREFKAAKSQREARHERQLLIYQDRFRAEVEFYKNQLYKTLEANREIEEKFRTLAERVKLEQALADQEAQDDEQRRRRARQARRNYDTLQSTFKALQLEMSRMNSQVASFSNVSSRQVKTYWSWAQQSFTAFRRSCAAHTNPTSTQLAVFNSIERLLKTRVTESPVTADMLGFSALRAVWRSQAHRARDVTRALRYERQVSRAFRFIEAADAPPHISLQGSLLSTVRRYLPRGTFLSTDLELKNIQRMLRPKVVDLNGAYNDIAKVVRVKWARMAPPAEQIAFAESRKLFDTSPHGRLRQAVDLVYLVCDRPRVQSLMYGFRSQSFGAQFERYAEALLKYRYQQEKTGSDIDAEHDRALIFINTYDRVLARQMGERSRRRLGFGDYGRQSDHALTVRTQGAMTARSRHIAPKIRLATKSRTLGETQTRAGRRGPPFRRVSTERPPLSPETLAARVVISSASSPEDDSTGTALAESRTSHRRRSQSRIRWRATSDHTAAATSIAGGSLAHTQGPLFRPTHPMRSADLTKQYGTDDMAYHIPASVFRAAKDALAAGEDGYWSYTLFKSPSGTPVRVHYCTSKAAAETVASGFADQDIVGFDMEWEIGSQIGRNSVKDLVSVIQLASEDRVAVFHLAMFRGETAADLMPAALKTLLESDRVTKAGVNIAGDFTRLRRCLGVSGRGVFELSHLYKVIRYSELKPELVNRIPARLEEQVQYAFGLPLLKGPVRISAWSSKLSNEQIDYAATDAYAGLRLFHEMDRRRKSMDPRPPLPAFYESGQQIILGNGLPPPKRIKDSVLSSSTEGSLEAAARIEFDSEEERIAEVTEVSMLEDIDDVPCTSESIESINEEKVFSPSDARLVTVDDWVAGYRTVQEKSGQSGRYQAKPAALRAYALWHQHDMTVEEVAGILRNPPLKAATVNSYILEAIASDRKLPVDAARLRIVFSGLPGFVAVRFKGLARTLGAA